MVSRNKKLNKKIQTETRNNFYLSFFKNKSEYQEKEINGFYLVKSYNTETRQCQGSLYNKDSFNQYKNFKS